MKAVETIRFWVSSWHCRKPIANAVGVKEKVMRRFDDDSITWDDNLAIYQDPQRPFWVTKEAFRDHVYKKEFEDIDKCDQIVCHDSELEERLELALGYAPSFRKRRLRQLCNSPYVYGADIDTETLIKQSYVNRVPVGKVAQFSKGNFDIEAEVRDDHRINIITFIHEHQIYTAALKEYCKIHNEDGSVKEATEEDCCNVIYDKLGYYFAEHKFELNFYIARDEVDLITWIFKKIHLHKTDYIGVWNMNFDLPHILKRLEELHVDPAPIMCHPDVPEEYKFVYFHEDKKATQHFTDKWHWMTIAGYSQFIDSMCLYARLRKVSGRESSYSLDDISTKELGHGKLHFGSLTNHWYLQNYKFLDYIAYNVNDVLIMQLMEWKNNDMGALCGLTGMSLLSQFSKQTIMVKNDAYNYGRKAGKVPASASMNMMTEYDGMMGKAGGTVLPPDKAIGMRINAVREFQRPTLVFAMNNDLDVTSTYPSIVSAFNISKETSLATVIGINGHPLQDTELFFGGITQPKINAMQLCKHFYGLDDYSELAERYRAHLRVQESMHVS